jgi:glycine oxidase ThiO
MDIAIVGAGIIGCAVARELASRGVRCALFDDRPVAGGATQASAGMLAPYVEAHEPGPLLDAGVRSLSLYDAWIDAVREESGLDVEYRRIGTLEVATDPDGALALQGAAARVPALRTFLTAADVARDHPAVGAVAGALFTPVHGYVAAPDLAAALAAAAERRGTRVHHTCVRAIDASAQSVRLRTNDQVVDAGGVVIAAGAWANSIDGIQLPPVHPVRGQILRLGWHGRPLSTMVWGPECYIVPRVDETILVGATVEDVGFDERNTAAGIRDLLDAACDLLPEAWGATFIEARAGLRPATSDALPVIGPDPRQPLVVHAAGHYRNGVLLAPITARAIGDWIVDRRRDPLFDVFSADRF